MNLHVCLLFRWSVGWSVKISKKGKEVTLTSLLIGPIFCHIIIISLKSWAGEQGSWYSLLLRQSTRTLDMCFFWERLLCTSSPSLPHISLTRICLIVSIFITSKARGPRVGYVTLAEWLVIVFRFLNLFSCLVPKYINKTCTWRHRMYSVKIIIA